MLDFDDLVRREADGSVLLGVDRTFARRFYTNVSLNEIEARTGQTPYFEKAVIYTALVGAPVLLLLSVIRSPWVIGWWSALSIPVAVLIWIGFYGDSARAGARLRVISVVVVGVGIGTLVTDGQTRAVWFLGFVYASALWLTRLLYISATSFLRALVLQNRRAWEWLHEQFVLRDAR